MKLQKVLTGYVSVNGCTFNVMVEVYDNHRLIYVRKWGQRDYTRIQRVNLAKDPFTGVKDILKSL